MGDAKRKAAGTVPDNRAVKTFKLVTPIIVGDVTYAEMIVTEPRVNDRGRAEEAEAKKPGSLMPALLGQVSDLPPDAVARLKLRDIGEVQRWFRKLSNDALEIDGLLPDGMPATDSDADPFEDYVDRDDDVSFDELETSRTFQLNVPFDYDGRTWTEITVSEPDLEAATAATKFKHDSQQVAAMISVMAGVKLPVIGRMVQRDANRIEAWMAPFVRQFRGGGAG